MILRTLHFKLLAAAVALITLLLLLILMLQWQRNHDQAFQTTEQELQENLARLFSSSHARYSGSASASWAAPHDSRYARCSSSCSSVRSSWRIAMKNSLRWQSDCVQGYSAPVTAGLNSPKLGEHGRATNAAWNRDAYLGAYAGDTGRHGSTPDERHPIQNGTSAYWTTLHVRSAGNS